MYIHFVICIIFGIKRKMNPIFAIMALIFPKFQRFSHHPTVQNMDTRYNYGEERWIAIGLIKSHTIAVVVYVEKTEDTIRIISARKANNTNLRSR